VQTQNNTDSPTSQIPYSMSTGKSFWWMKDAEWWDRSRVGRLALRHGPLGPAVLDWLSCHAKATNTGGGQVKSGYGAVAKGICALVPYAGQPEYTPESVIEPVVTYMVQIGVLDDYVQLDDDRFVCRISGWSEDQRRGLKAAQNDSYQATLRSSKSVSVDLSAEEVEGELEEEKESALDLSIIAARELYKTSNEGQRKVLASLIAVAEAKSVKPFKPESLLAACERYPDRDHPAEAEGYRYWHLDGNGENAMVVGLSQSWSRWLSRAPSAEKRNAKRGFQGEDRGMPFGLGA